MSSDFQLLSEIANIQGGYAFKSVDFCSEGAAVIKIANIQPPVVSLANVDRVKNENLIGLDRFKLNDRDILMAMTGATVGKVGRFKETETAYLNQRVARIFAKKGHEYDDFIYALISLNGFDKQIEGSASGSAQPNISTAGIGSVKVPVVSECDQKYIGSFVCALDDRIALLRETNATLEAIAQALFKSWFVDFDPVRAKQEGREPEGMDADTAALFPDSFEESELGLVPKGWRIGVLGDIADTVRKQIFPSELHSELHYVGLEHMPRHSLSLNIWGNANGLESAKAAFSEGDILFGKLRPYFHKVVIAPFAGVCSTDILVCRSKQTAFYGVILMHLFSVKLIEYASRLSNGAKMPRINWKDIAAYSICIPPSIIADKYSKAVAPLFASMVANAHRIQTLASIRDTLLPRLISGQLRLPEAEVIIEEAIA